MVRRSSARLAPIPSRRDSDPSPGRSSESDSKRSGLKRWSSSSQLLYALNPSHRQNDLAIGVELPGTPKGIDRIVIRPGNRLIEFFDVIVGVCVLYSSIVAPMEVAYRAVVKKELEYAFDALFTADMLLQFVCGYMERGYPVLILRAVAHRYATTWFIVDLVAVIPWDHLAGSEMAFLALIKTVRLLKLRRLLNRTMMSEGGNVVRVVVILSVWLLITHWSACAFFALGDRLCNNGKYQNTWLTVYFDGSQDDQELPIINRENCGDGAPDKFGKVHIRAMYWALSTMSSLGYGTGPVAVTDAEYVFAIALQVLGAILAAAIFSNIAKLIEKLDAAGARYSALLDRMNEFGQFHRLPHVMRQKLQGYVSFLFAVNRGIDINDVTSSLPPALQTEVLYMMHEHLVRQVPMFADTDDIFIKALVRVLKPQVLMRGDCAFRVNEPGDCMYFIQSGCVQITNVDRSVVFVTLMPGAYFGELAMLTSQRRTATAQAVDDCILFYMQACDFDEVIKDFPRYYDMILESAMHRLEKTLQSNATLEQRMEYAQTKQRLKKHRMERLGSAGPLTSTKYLVPAGAGAGTSQSPAPTSNEEQQQTQKTVSPARQRWNTVKHLIDAANEAKEAMLAQEAKEAQEGSFKSAKGTGSFKKPQGSEGAPRKLRMQPRVNSRRVMAAPEPPAPPGEASVSSPSTASTAMAASASPEAAAPAASKESESPDLAGSMTLGASKDDHAVINSVKSSSPRLNRKITKTTLELWQEQARKDAAHALEAHSAPEEMSFRRHARNRSAIKLGGVSGASRKVRCGKDNSGGTLSSAKERLSVRFSPICKRRASVDSAAVESFSSSQQSAEILAAIHSLAAEIKDVRTAVDGLRGEAQTQENMKWRSPAAPPTGK